MRLFFHASILLFLAAIAGFFLSGEQKTAPAVTLVDPEQAPDPLHAAVEQGFRQMMQTKTLLPDYVGNSLSCSNCHFDGGNSSGGLGTGIPLAGVAAAYPQFNQRSGSVETLADRINNCFTNSMNGKALPLGSKEMTAFLTYFQWISSGIPIYSDTPWLGLPRLKTLSLGDPEKGKKLFMGLCADCHGRDGEGKSALPKKYELSAPPLWGAHSFNNAAGMNKLETLSAFIYRNMPYDAPGISVEEAVDISAFILQQPRPTKR